MAPLNGLNKTQKLTAIEWFENIIEKFLLNFLSFKWNFLFINLYSITIILYNYFLLSFIVYLFH
jgi:hypothetical protein